MKLLTNPVYRNYVAAAIWLALAYPTIVWWKESVLWVASMSLYTIVLGHIDNAATHRARIGNSADTDEVPSDDTHSETETP